LAALLDLPRQVHALQEEVASLRAQLAARDHPRGLPVRETAQLLGVSEVTIRRRLSDGGLRRVPGLGRTVRVIVPDQEQHQRDVGDAVAKVRAPDLIRRPETRKGACETVPNHNRGR
jgi:hypothetical protein